MRDLTRDGRWSTYDVSVLKLSNVSFRGKCACMGNTLKIPSLTKLDRLGHFPPASQVGRYAGPVFYVYVLWVGIKGTLVEDKMSTFKDNCEHFSFNKCPTLLSVLCKLVLN